MDDPLVLVAFVTERRGTSKIGQPDTRVLKKRCDLGWSLGLRSATLTDAWR